MFNEAFNCPNVGSEAVDLGYKEESKSKEVPEGSKSVEKQEDKVKNDKLQADLLTNLMGMGFPKELAKKGIAKAKQMQLPDCLDAVI